MNKHELIDLCPSVRIERARFDNGNGVPEEHLMLHGIAATESFEMQLNCLQNALCHYLKQAENKSMQVAFKRYFVSDAANQADVIRQSEREKGAISLIQQAPLDQTKVALWVYLLPVEVCRTDIATYYAHHGYTHHWGAGYCQIDGDSEAQTQRILHNYIETLAEKGETLQENCIRTWFYCQDIDVNYNGLVKARRELFMQHGLTPQTHYITSTGIEGRNELRTSQVVMDAYSIKGLQQAQIQYLYAPTHLNPTYEYGVTFERGTCIEYGDRKHLFISGTASINNCGEVMYEKDIKQQTMRMWENVEVLLNERGGSYDHIMQLIVYLRDPSDYQVVKSLFEARFPNVPYILLHAPVCRPGWLIEMECIAVVPHYNTLYQPF